MCTHRLWGFSSTSVIAHWTGASPLAQVCQTALCWVTDFSFASALIGLQLAHLGDGLDNVGALSTL